MHTSMGTRIRRLWIARQNNKTLPPSFTSFFRCVDLWQYCNKQYSKDTFLADNQCNWSSSHKSDDELSKYGLMKRFWRLACQCVILALAACCLVDQEILPVRRFQALEIWDGNTLRNLSQESLFHKQNWHTVVHSIWQLRHRSLSELRLTQLWHKVLIGLVDLCSAIQGNLVNETRCLRCETVTSREEAFYDLSLEIEHNSSLTDCIKNFRSAFSRIQCWFFFDRKCVLLPCDASTNWLIFVFHRLLENSFTATFLRRFQLSFLPNLLRNCQDTKPESKCQAFCQSLGFFVFESSCPCFDLWFVLNNMGSCIGW